MSDKTLVLDAMGVLYRAADDVEELLLPFVEKHGTFDRDKVAQLYYQASMGKFTSSEFWWQLNINSGLEDEYLSGYQLSSGLLNFLQSIDERVNSIWCLSNDISEWSKKLRENFGIEKYFTGFIISGDVKTRKPSVEIYQSFIEISGVSPESAIFVDDREINLDTAMDLGFDTILFDLNDISTGTSHRVVRSFAELFELF